MKKIRIDTNQAIPGMVVAEDIYTYNNQLIITENTVVTDKMITRLKFYSIISIVIGVPDESPDELPAAPMHEDSYLTRNTSVFKEFHKTLLDTVDSFQDKMKVLTEKNGVMDIYGLEQDMKRLLSNCRNGIHVFDMIHCIRGFDDVTFVHSVNVSLICTVLGTWLNFSSEDLDVLMLCGLLHDLGKLTIPQDLLNKQGALTPDEYAVVKTHSMRGYNLLRPRDIDNRIKMAAMMHHERCDGSGYPMGLRGEQIDSFAKIVAIADVYDGMTSARVYRGSLCPFEVMHIYESEGLTRFDSGYVMTFLSHVLHSYIGSHVKLSDGTQGTVVLMNRNSLSRPLIKVKDRYIDLAKEPALYIAALL